MNEQALDAQGEAHDALGTAVASHGRRVLSDPDMLGNFVADLLPDLPRERVLLVTAAEAGIAAEMTRCVEEQHIDPDTAVQLVARSLAERVSIDRAASTWVTWEYARALGYQVRPYTLASPVGQPGAIPAAPPTAPAVSAPPTVPGVSAPPTMPAQPPTLVEPATQVPPPGQSWPPRGQSWPPDQGPSDRRPPPPWRTGGMKGGIIAAVTVVGVVVVYLIVAAAVRVAPFSPSPAPTRHPPTPHPTSAPSLAAGVVPLPQLLPSGVADPATECSTAKPPFKWSMPGLYDALTCVDPNLPGGKVTGFQLTSTASYLTAWQNFNKWWGFNPVTSAPTCPPTGNATQGSYPWKGNILFPLQTGQVLECGTLALGRSATPTYVYAMPTEDAFIFAQDPSFTTLQKWWSTSSMPLTSPSPTSS
jgi:hypothetical protein